MAILPCVLVSTVCRCCVDPMCLCFDSDEPDHLGLTSHKRNGRTQKLYAFVFSIHLDCCNTTDIVTPARVKKLLTCFQNCCELWSDVCFRLQSLCNPISRSVLPACVYHTPRNTQHRTINHRCSFFHAQAKEREESMSNIN